MKRITYKITLFNRFGEEVGGREYRYYNNESDAIQRIVEAYGDEEAEWGAVDKISNITGKVLSSFEYPPLIKNKKKRR
jgi:hypothetical protein